MLLFLNCIAVDATRDSINANVVCAAGGRSSKSAAAAHQATEGSSEEASAEGRG